MDIFVIQVVIETLYVAIQTFIYTFLLYFMIGFHWKLDKFLYFYYFIFVCFPYFSMYGMISVSLTPGLEIAAIFMSFFISIWNVFPGLIIPRPECNLRLISSWPSICMLKRSLKTNWKFSLEKLVVSWKLKINYNRMLNILGTGLLVKLIQNIWDDIYIYHNALSLKMPFLLLQS